MMRVINARYAQKRAKSCIAVMLKLYKEKEVIAGPRLSRVHSLHAPYGISRDAALASSSNAEYPSFHVPSNALFEISYNSA